MTIILRPDQFQLKQGVYDGWQSGNRHMLAVLPTGGGKCLARGTGVLMFDGTSKLVENIRNGDLVMGPDGGSRTVVNLCYGIDEMFTVTPKKGSPYTVNSSHILSLRRTVETAEPKYLCDFRGGEILNIPVNEYVKKTKWFKHIHKGWRTGIKFQNSQPVPIDAYWLGLWLGDGTSRTPAITSMDIEIIAYCSEFATLHNMRVRYETKKNSRATNIFFVQKNEKERKSTVLTNFLYSQKIYKNKHIPHIYKTASRENRLKLLAGLIDSDGHYSGKGYDFTLKSERLLDDLIFVARSLGFAAYKNPVRKTCCNNGVTGDYFRCNISGDIDEIPCRVFRKKAKIRQQKKNVLNVGITVKSSGYGEYFGFTLEGKDRLFLLDDFTVTHNSVVVSEIVKDKNELNAQQVVIAHRTELISQMSGHIANRGIYHRIIGPTNVVGQIIAQHRRDYGRSFLSPSASCTVAGVDTLNARAEDLKKWAAQQDFWTIDEAHHVVRDNKWGRAVAMFPRAYGLGVTATPQRADGLGLGSHADGVFDSMVVGPSPRELMDLGAITDYEYIVPASDFYISDSDITPSGDFSQKKMAEASKKSHIVGDVVKEYVKNVFGKRAIVFATDVEAANKIAERFKEVHIPAAAVSAQTPSEVRAEYIRRFRDGRLWVLVNVDLFGEGFDVPACEVVILARPTASLSVFLQQCGRALRIMFGKLFGIIIDHVSNYKRHGWPDKKRYWTLDRRDKRAKSKPDPEDMELTACRTCSKAYERVLPACPHCGAEPIITPQARSSIKEIDGDLILLDRAKLAELRAAAELESPASVGQRVGAAAGSLAAAGHINRQIERIQAQQRLSHAIALWAGLQRSKGRSDQESYRRFYLTAGIDVLSAIGQSRADMEKLAEIVEGWMR